MGRIRILSDRDGVYEVGSIINVGSLIVDYCNCTNDKDLINWLYNIPIPSAVAFITKAWEIDYEYV